MTLTNNAKDILKYAFKSDDGFFMDANVWLYIHFPDKLGSGLTSAYSQSWEHMKTSGCKIRTNELIISEVVNTYARTRYNAFAEGAGVGFKQFRESGRFKPIAEEIAARIKKIMGGCAMLESRLDNNKICALIDKFAKGRSDFNDQVIIELCKMHNLTLVTHDADFANCGVPILTANRRLLAGRGR